MTDQGKSGSFGSCCDELKEVMEATDFDPLIATSADDGILYMSIGMLDAEENEANVVDHPVFFCPFCGTKLQTREEVEAKGFSKDDPS